MKTSRSWWQKIKHYPFITIGIIVVLCVLIASTFAAYRLGWSVVGFNGGYPKITTTMITPGTTVASEQQPAKTLWDWLQLLIIPVALALIALLFNRATTRTEQKIAADR